MLYVIFSVCCSIVVAVLIKFARKKNVNVQQIVLWNYPMTVVLTYTLLNPTLQQLNISLLPFTLYLPLIFLLPSLFIFIALAIKYSGIVKTDVAQRMSLFIPLIASFIFFGETLHLNKAIGIAVGLLALVFSISWSKSKDESSNKALIYPLIVFFGMGVIDILFKQIAQHQAISYINSMFIVFIGAMFVAFLLLVFKIFIKKEVFDKSAIGWGLLLGAFNFGNIYFYMKAHRALPDNPSVVFTSMNIGVIVVGTLAGVILFQEKLTKINLIGLILATVSIFLITYL